MPKASPGAPSSSPDCPREAKPIGEAWSTPARRVVERAFGVSLDRIFRATRLLRRLARRSGNLGVVRDRVHDIRGVPTRVYEGDSDHLLLYGHRGTLSKDADQSVLLCRRLAEETGLTIVSIDAPQHGARSARTGDLANDRRLMEEAVVAGGEEAAADWMAVVEGLDIGPAVAYVGFSMGAMHGTIAAAAIPTLRAAVFGMAGVPVFALESVRETGSDTPHMAAARRLRDCDVLMVNTTGDDMFPPDAAVALFDAFPSGRKRMMLWEGDHGTEPAEMIDEIIRFIKRHLPSTSS